MTSHTPGPWQIGQRHEEDLPILDAAGNYVALADFAYLANNADKIDANARLIAAAPELLAALRYAATYLGDDGTDDSPEARETRATIRAAIAKAEGR